MPAIFAYVTARDREEALRIGRALVEERLAACANVLDGMTSVYRWEGRMEESAEAVLLVKSEAERAQAIVARVRELHSYSVPCVAIWPVPEGNPPYLDWIRKESGHA
jgi:periplasmic divalent cation tolerance protein